MFAAVWLILTGTLLGPQDATSAGERKLSGAVDPRVELMSVIFRFAGNPEYNMANSKSPYADDVDQQLGRSRNHAVVKYAQELRKKSGISYDAVMSLAVHLTDALELNEKVPFDEAPARLDRRWKPDEARQFLKLAREFVQEAGFKRFLRKHEAFYKAAGERLTAQLDQRDYLKWFDGFFGAQPKSSYSVALGLLVGGSNYGVGVRYPDGREEIASVIGVWRFDEQGLPVFDDSFGTLLVHELCHSYTNRLVDKYQALLEPAGVALYSQVGSQMERQAYGNWKTMMYESLVRACVARYELAVGGEEAAAKVQSEDESRGFTWIGDLIQLLGEYEQNRAEHATLDDFMPHVLVFFDKYAKDAAPQLAQKTESPITASIAPPEKPAAAKPDQSPKASVAPAPEPSGGGALGQAKRKVAGGGATPRVTSIEPGNGARNVSPDVKEIVVRFDRAMTDKSFSVCGSGPNFPEIAGDVSFDPSRKTLTIPVKLKPNWSYEFSLNCESYRNFKSADGVELEPYKVTFSTSAR